MVIKTHSRSYFQHQLTGCDFLGVSLALFLGGKKFGKERAFYRGAQNILCAVLVQHLLWRRKIESYLGLAVIVYCREEVCLLWGAFRCASLYCKWQDFWVAFAVFSSDALAIHLLSPVPCLSPAPALSEVSSLLLPGLRGCRWPGASRDRHRVCFMC